MRTAAARPAGSALFFPVPKCAFALVLQGEELRGGEGEVKDAAVAARLALRAVGPQAAGRYACAASNTLGRGRSADLAIAVHCEYRLPGVTGFTTWICTLTILHISPKLPRPLSVIISLWLLSHKFIGNPDNFNFPFSSEKKKKHCRSY